MMNSKRWSWGTKGIAGRRLAAVTGTLILLVSGSSVRAALIENFQSYSAGLVSSGVTGGVWTAQTVQVTAPAPSDTATIQDESGNLLLSIGTTASANSGTYRSLPTPIPGNTASAATLFFRARANGTGLNQSIGLSDVAAPADPNAFGAFETQLRMTNTSGSNLRFDVRNGSSFVNPTNAAPITVGTWYNVWIVANTMTDKWDLYINTGSANATAADLKMANIGFRDGTDANTALGTFLFYSGAGSALAASIDDINVTPGVDLTNYAVPEPASCVPVLTGLCFFVLRKRNRAVSGCSA